MLIWNYTLIKWSENQADIYYQMLIESPKEIAFNPALGKGYSGISENLPGFKSGRHIFFYHNIDENEREIIRILYDRMDVKNRITRKQPCSKKSLRSSRNPSRHLHEAQDKE